MRKRSLHRKFRYAASLMKPRGHGRGHGHGKRHEHNTIADPTRGQGRILAILKLQDGISTRHLAFMLGLRTASLNELLAKLEQAGLVTREQSEEDRRVILIHLTDAGRATEQSRPHRPRVFASLTEEEQNQLSSILDKMIAQLEAEADESAPDREAEEYDRWGQKLRARMGEEKFERWLERMAELSPEGLAMEHRHRRWRRRA